MGGDPGRAVMERRAARGLDEDAHRALWRKLDFFPTPPWAARAGGELLQKMYPKARNVWEPACGEGHMAMALNEYFHTVKRSDIYDHGHGAVQDFLGVDPAPAQWDLVVTNPPFPKAAEFVRRGLQHAPAVAILARLSFLESAGRYDLFRRLACVAVFSERVAMQLGSWDPNLSTATAYAWFVFELWHAGDAALPGWKGMHIPPGTKARLTKDTDARRFARAAEAPLLDSASQ